MGLKLWRSSSQPHMGNMRTFILLLAALQYAQSMDQREGQILSPSFSCGKYTTRTVLIGSGTTSVIKSDKGTMRCTVLFKMSYCKRNKPNERYPAVSTGNMKMWYTAKGGKRYPKKGFSCTTVCSKTA